MVTTKTVSAVQQLIKHYGININLPLDSDECCTHILFLIKYFEKSKRGFRVSIMSACEVFC